MFKVDIVSDKLYGIVGLRQSFNPNYAILDDDNQVSRSGYYITDNPYVKLEYLKAVGDYKDISDADFNTYLKRIQKSSIINVCHQVFSRFDYLDRNLLYSNAQNRVEQEELEDGFVGYKIEVASDRNIAFQIKRVLLEFDTVGDFKLMLFNTSKDEPIYSEDITIESKTQELELNWTVDNSDSTYKGNYYLGYIKTDETPIPFKREYGNSNIMNGISHLKISKRIVEGHSTETLFDLDDEEGLSENIGINPDIVVYEDYTDLIKQNEMLFSRAIQLDMTIAVLREYLNSLRSSGDQRKANEIGVKVLTEIEGQSGEGFSKITGLRPQLIGEIKSIGAEINKLKSGYFSLGLTKYTLN